MTPAPLRRTAGVTLVEMTVVTAIFSLLLLVFFKSMIMVQGGNERMTQHNRLHTKCQQALSRLARQASASVRLYSDGTESQALFDLLEGVPARRLNPSLLPVVVADGVLDKDQPGQRATGNALVFLQAMRPLEYTPVGQTTKTERIDLYRMSAVFLARKPGVVGTISARADGIDLVSFRSAPLIDYDQVMAIDDPALQADVLATARTSRGVRLLFDTGAPIASALKAFDDAGTIDTSPPAPYQIPADSEKGFKSFYQHLTLSVATNGAPPQHGVARFSQTDPTADGFPHGFEVRIHGKSGARSVTMHLVLVNRSLPSGDLNYTDLTASAVARDF